MGLNGHHVRTGPPQKPVEYRVEPSIGGGYLIKRDGETIGFDSRRSDANQTANSLAAEARVSGLEAVSYPCLEEE